MQVLRSQMFETGAMNWEVTIAIEIIHRLLSCDDLPEEARRSGE